MNTFHVMLPVRCATSKLKQSGNDELVRPREATGLAHEVFRPDLYLSHFEIKKYNLKKAINSFFKVFANPYRNLPCGNFLLFAKDLQWYGPRASVFNTV